MKFSTLVTRSDLSAARKVEPLILAELKRHRYSDEAVFAVRLALEEALANAVNHGNCRDETKQVQVDYAVNDEQAVIRVTDEGCGFDRHEVPDPTTPENVVKDHGRGIMLMEAYMSEVNYNAEGNCVEMVKRNE